MVIRQVISLMLFVAIAVPVYGGTCCCADPASIDRGNNSLSMVDLKIDRDEATSCCSRCSAENEAGPEPRDEPPCDCRDGCECTLPGVAAPAVFSGNSTLLCVDAPPAGLRDSGTDALAAARAYRLFRPPRS